MTRIAFCEPSYECHLSLIFNRWCSMDQQSFLYGHYNSGWLGGYEWQDHQWCGKFCIERLPGWPLSSKIVSGSPIVSSVNTNNVRIGMTVTERAYQPIQPSSILIH